MSVPLEPINRLSAPITISQRLTPREWQIAGLVADGFSNAAISRQTGITRGVVANFLGRIYTKLSLTEMDGDYNIRVVLTNLINIERTKYA